jgi:RNA polymerase sigma factor (sigma-70 family)
MKATVLQTVVDKVRRDALRQEGAELSDRELFEAYLFQRDSSSLEALVHRHGPMVFGVCRRILHNVQDAEDAFQATFLVLLRRAESVWPREQVGNWLYGVAYRTALEARRLAAKRHRREQPLTGREDRAVTPAEPASWQDIKPVLDQELAHLPDKFRSVVVLCDLEGRTRKEAAGHLGLPEGTVSGRLTTARRMLAQRLARRGLSLTGGVLLSALGHTTASAEIPPVLVTATVQQTISFHAGANILALADAVWHTTVVARWKPLLLPLAMGLALCFFGGAVLREGAEPSRPEPAPTPRPPRDAVSLHHQQLQGTWVAVAGEMDGLPEPEQTYRDLRLVFEGNCVTYWTRKGAQVATFRLNPTKTPQEIDMEFAGNILRGIYHLEGNRLKICWTKLGRRPRTFHTTEGEPLTFLFLFEKQP